MKKTLACVAGLLALAGAYGVWGNWTSAQAPPGNPQNGNPAVRPVSASAPAPQTQPTTTPMTNAQMPSTRVAVVNINKVLRNYNKAQNLNAQIRTKVQKYATDMNAKREEITKLQAELAKPTIAPADKERYEKQIVAIQRYLQDVDNEARKTIGKEQGDIAIMIFREIEGVIRAVATTNNFDIVMSFPDATDDHEMYTQENVVRKLAAQAAMPMYYKPHVDITSAVVQTLNASYPAPPAPPTTGQTPTAPGAPGAPNAHPGTPGVPR